jgi:hypothetical protein
VVTLTCSGAPAGAACSISPATVTLSGTTAATATITVTTKAASLVWLPGATERSQRIKLMLLFVFMDWRTYWRCWPSQIFIHGVQLRGSRGASAGTDTAVCWIDTHVVRWRKSGRRR